MGIINGIKNLIGFDKLELFFSNLSPFHMLLLIYAMFGIVALFFIKEIVCQYLRSIDDSKKKKIDELNLLNEVIGNIEKKDEKSMKYRLVLEETLRHIYGHTIHVDHFEVLMNTRFPSEAIKEYFRYQGSILLDKKNKCFVPRKHWSWRLRLPGGMSFIVPWKIPIFLLLAFLITLIIITIFSTIIEMLIAGHEPLKVMAGFVFIGTISPFFWYLLRELHKQFAMIIYGGPYVLPLKIDKYL